MFFFDDVVMSPFKGFLFIAKEVAKAVDQAKEAERASAMTELSQLHLRLEQGEISEEEFDQRETELLDLLESEE
ncbi:MAG: gas vesicle protein GvpG [Pirellulaceae bacterium]|nr:gas vesicle protein GvpG [Pirellulaceae bacterium]